MILVRITALLLIVLSIPLVSWAQNDIFQPYLERGIVVAQESDMAPMSFQGHNGEPKGYIIDLWRKWSAETGVPVRFHLVDWVDTLTAVRDGKADVHGGLFFTAERDEYLDYTPAFFPSKGGFFVKAGSSASSPSDLEGRPVGVIDGSFYADLIRKQFPEMKPVPVRTSTELVEVADSGKVDAFLADYPTLMYQIGSMGKGNEFRLVEVISHQEFRAAVAQGNEGLREMIQLGLLRIDQDERNTLLNRWIIGDESQPGNWLLPVVVICFTGLLFAVILPFFWGRRD